MAEVLDLGHDHHLPRHHRASQRRVEKVGVSDGEDQRPPGGHVLQPDDLQLEEDLGQYPDDRVR